MTQNTKHFIQKANKINSLLKFNEWVLNDNGC